MSTGVYLAAPIDQRSEASRRVTKALVDEIVAWLGDSRNCAWVFDPGSAFHVGGAIGLTSDIRAINAAALDRAGVLVAHLPAGTVSVGVPMEIDRAVRAGKQVLVISDAPSWMLRFEEPNVQVYPTWGSLAQTWLSVILGWASEDTTSPSRVPVPVVVDEGAEEPRRGYDDDAGLDLVVSQKQEVLPGEFVDIPCGVRAQLPDWAWGMITGRSSTLRKRGLLVNPGIIDSGYRGPLFAGAWNLTDKPVVVEKGERIAQLLVMRNETRRVRVVQVDRLEDSERGTAGFGSTGV